VEDDTGQSDERLAHAARTDRAAFGALYDRYLPRVYRFCARRSDSPADAEDLTAAVFLRAMERIGTFQGGSFAAWLFTIARHACADFHRRRPTGSLDDAAFVVDGATSPDELAIAAERYRWLRAQMARLTPEQADVIELRLAQLSTAEIAHALEKSIPAVKMLQSRALAVLRAAAATETEEEDQHDRPE
jgi:RNA polymerase sigma-70 factor, ECF subfamily